MSCDNILQNVTALDLDDNEHSALPQQTIRRQNRSQFEPKHKQTAICPKTLTAHVEASYSFAKLTSF